MAAQPTITVEIKLAWWFSHLYLPLLGFFYWITINYFNADAQINGKKFAATVKRGVKMYINGKRVK